MAKGSQTDLDLRGDLQTEVMHAVWKLGEARVDEVRELQPRKRRLAYTTIQTVMNRLVKRGLLVRQRRGKAFVYRPRLEESDYVAEAIRERLADASPDARRAALVELVDRLEPGDVDELARYANRVRRARGRGS